ncbi:hypothetical protein WP5W18E02_23040 [Aeromonas caviae]|nr:hypothetical protein WP5W18E02_23040 [Aeromonas caviae]
MKMKRHYSGVFLIVGCWSQLVGGYDPSPLCPVAKSDRGDGGDMGRSIQGLEDLHHGFPVDRVGQRHRGFAFETVTGTPAITWGDFEGVFDAGHSGTYLSGHNTRGWPSEAMQQSLSPARRNHSLPPCVDAIDDALPLGSGTQHDNVGNTASKPCTWGQISSQTIGKRKDASRAPF